jgi:hypothetical protein
MGAAILLSYLQKDTFMTTDMSETASVAASLGNSGNTGNGASVSAAAAVFETGVAREVALGVIDTMQREHGVTPEATETAVRVLLLAAALLLGHGDGWQYGAGLHDVAG